jgi:metal-dependent amidase/aminoacylase/carboxypeptidase family protein
MPGIKEHILEKSADLKEEVLQRHFHRYPELSCEETEKQNAGTTVCQQDTYYSWNWKDIG